MPMKSLPFRHPIFFGVLVAVGLFVFIVIASEWFPSVLDYEPSHRGLVQAVVFTGVLYLCMATLTEFRRRNRTVFYSCLGVMLAIHLAGVCLYSICIGPILTWQWVPLLAVEATIADYALDWATRGPRSQMNHP
jgi:hypothetical protein